MNKLFPIIATALIAPVLLTGCGKTADYRNAPDARIDPPFSIETPAPSDTAQDTAPRQNFQITIDGDDFNDLYCRPPVSGIIRRFIHDNSGIYSVEYVHTPFGLEEDSTLDYLLKLNADHTFELTVTSEGVTAEHNGRWYERCDQIMMFYDEHIDPPAHNVYIADCLYGDKLNDGKLMIYENGRTIVLSRQQQQLYRR